MRSKKRNLTTRRIKLLATGAVYQVRPDFVLPYMTGKTDLVEKGLYLRRFGVPFDALASVFGRDASYQYGSVSDRGQTLKYRKPYSSVDFLALIENSLNCIS